MASIKQRLPGQSQSDDDFGFVMPKQFYLCDTPDLHPYSAFTLAQCTWDAVVMLMWKYHDPRMPKCFSTELLNVS